MIINFKYSMLIILAITNASLIYSNSTVNLINDLLNSMYQVLTIYPEILKGANFM